MPKLKKKDCFYFLETLFASSKVQNTLLFLFLLRLTATRTRPDRDMLGSV